MVLMFLADVVLQTSWWGMKKIYDGGYYLYYGVEESKEDKILREIDELKKQNEELRLQNLEFTENIYALYGKELLTNKKTLTYNTN